MLSLIAPKSGDVAGAKSDSLNAGNAPGTSTSSSFGPTMVLAKALLDAGQSEAVLQYFDECRKFWKMDCGKLDQWSADVRAGKKPNLGANLVY